MSTKTTTIPLAGHRLDAEIFRLVVAGARPSVRHSLDLDDTFDLDAAVARHCDRTYRPDSLLTRAESAAVVGVSVSRLAQLRRAGEINHRKNLVTNAVSYSYGDLVRLRKYRSRTVIERSA